MPEDGESELAGKRTGATFHALAVPLDSAVPTEDPGEALSVGDNAEPVRFRQCQELLNGEPLLRDLSPTCFSDHCGN